MPQDDVLERRGDVGPHDAGEPGQVLGQHRVALVRHGGRAFLARREILLGLAQLGALEVADLGREALDGGRDQPERGEERGVPVARDDLRRDRLDREPEFLRHMRLDARIDVRERAHRARYRAGRDLGPRGGEAVPVARELGIVSGELEPEGRGFGVDAVAAPDTGGQPVLARAALERRHDRSDTGVEQVGGAGQLHGEAGIQHVRRGHPLVDEARLGPDMLGEVGEERDHVVPRLALDLVDPLDFEGAPLADRLRGRFRDATERRLRVAGMGFDLQPDAEPGLGRPERRHLFSRIARDHSALAPVCRRGGV